MFAPLPNRFYVHRKIQTRETGRRCRTARGSQSDFEMVRFMDARREGASPARSDRHRQDVDNTYPRIPEEYRLYRDERVELPLSKTDTRDYRPLCGTAKPFQTRQGLYGGRDRRAVGKRRPWRNLRNDKTYQGNKTPDSACSKQAVRVKAQRAAQTLQDGGAPQT